tara:strand:+ start:41 stop:586 length:546 start_codon:yes stop_codon:yes gene_type:complete
MNQSSATKTYGLMAEFETPEDLLEGAKQTYAAGFRSIDAFSPFPIHGLGAAIGFARTNLPILTFLCGVMGALCGYGLQYWVHVIDYPIDIGGRPAHSGLMFIPVTFEVTILFAAVGTFLGLWIRNKLPMPYHPVFNVPSFSKASQDGFFLCIESTDPQFDEGKTRSFLQSLNPIEVTDVDP